MRLKTWSLVGAAGAVLAFAGVAIAVHAPGSASTVSATGAASTATNVTTTTCSVNGQSFELTKGTYSGTASSGTPALNGPISLKVDSWIDTTASNVGLLNAHFQINGPGPGHTDGHLSAVNNNGTLSGWVDGHGPSDLHFSGTFSGSWNKTTGFGSLSIGTGSASNVVLAFSGHCPQPPPKDNKPPAPPKPHPAPPHGPSGPSGASGPSGPPGPHHHPKP